MPHSARYRSPSMPLDVAALAVACPYCHAKPGEPCAGRRTPHRSRVAEIEERNRRTGTIR